MADLDDLGTQFPQRRRRHLVGGTIGRIDDDAQTIERHVLRISTLGEFNVTRVGILDALGAADLVGHGDIDL